MGDSETSAESDEYKSFRLAAGIFTPLPGAGEGDECMTDEDCTEGYVCMDNACMPAEEKAMRFRV